MWEPLAEDASSFRWSSLAPVHAESFFDDNRAAFGNDKATPAYSLRPIIDANAIISAIVDGGTLDPAPRVEILDMYGQVVLGAFASDITVEARQIEEATDVTIYGGVKSLSNASEGDARFESLGLRGKPRSGPHELSFAASIQLGGQQAHRLYYMKRTITDLPVEPGRPGVIQAWVRLPFKHVL